MRKQKPKRGEDILFFFTTQYLDSLSYSIEKTAYPHKRHKAGFCPNYQKTKNRKKI